MFSQIIIIFHLNKFRNCLLRRLRHLSFCNMLYEVVGDKFVRLMALFDESFSQQILQLELVIQGCL